MKSMMIVFTVLAGMLILQGAALSEDLGFSKHKAPEPGPAIRSIPVPPGASADWKSLGPAGLSVLAAAVSPDFDSDGTLFAGTYGHGVFKSTDKGATWTQVNKAYADYIPGGIYYGELDDLDNIEALAISPDYGIDRTLFAGTCDRGIFRTINGGKHWLRVNDGLGGLEVHSIACSPDFADDDAVFTGLRYGGGLHLSYNAGSWWTASSTAISEPMPFAFSPDFAADQTMYLGAGDGIYKSIDGGSTWSGFGLGGKSFQSLVCHPTIKAKVKFLLAGSAYHGIYIRVLDSFPKHGGHLGWSEVNTGLEDVTGGIVETLALSPRFATDRKVFAAICLGPESRVYQATVNALVFPHILGWNQVGSTVEGYQVDTMAAAEDDGAVRLFVGTASGGGGNGLLTLVVD